jgi:hypothetical protein
MALTTTFKSNLKNDILTTGNTVYTCPAGNTATVIGFSISNKTANVITANVWIHRGTIDYYTLANVSIFGGSAMTPYGEPQKLVLQASDSINCSVSLATAADAIISVLEVF